MTTIHARITPADDTASMPIATFLITLLIVLFILVKSILIVVTEYELNRKLAGIGPL